jgi:hypothetical protein
MHAIGIPRLSTALAELGHKFHVNLTPSLSSTSRNTSISKEKTTHFQR